MVFLTFLRGMAQVHLNIMDSFCPLHSLVRLGFYSRQYSVQRHVDVDVSLALIAAEYKLAYATESIGTGGISSLLKVQANYFGATH